ncbi:MAG: hypothetical protein KBG40_04740 [Bacteroidales bacterium]|nr:hypothetical protein [Bacteroidales bacterium]
MLPKVLQCCYQKRCTRNYRKCCILIYRLQLSLKPIEESEGQAENTPENGVSANQQNQQQDKTETVGVQNSSMLSPKEEIKGTLEDRFAMASASSPPKVERKDTFKGIKL